MKSGMKGRLFGGAAIAVLISGAAWALPAQPMLQVAKGGAASEARVWLASAEDGAPGDKMWRGDDKGESVSDDVTDLSGGEDDGMVWAGGDPDFCEACGGEIVDEGAEPETVTEEVDAELGDPLDTDDGMMWAGGDPDFCEACGGVVMDDGDVVALGAGAQQERGALSEFAGRAPGSDDRDRQCGMAGTAHRCGDR